jgi:hypothetical protein
MALLGMKQVRDELKLTDFQKARLNDLDTEAKRDFERIRQKQQERAKEQLGDQPDPLASRAVRASLGDVLTAMDDQSEAAARKILDRSQYTRVEQIHFQSDGSSLFVRPEVQERLNLSPEQVQLIRAIVSQGNSERLAATILPPGVLPDPKESTREERLAFRKSAKYKGAVKDVRKAALKIRESTMQSIAKVLTRGQRERYLRMVGEPFDFKKLWDAPASQPTEAKR